MKKIILASFSFMALTVLVWTSATAQQKRDKSSADDDFYENEVDNPGVWSAVVRNDKAYIQFGGFHWSSGSTFPVSELGTLPVGTPGAFVVKRDPGTVTFNGVFNNDHGHGTYVFEANSGFTGYLAQEGFKDISEELMLHLFFTNINKEYFSYMKQSGYDGITMSQLKDLAYHNVNRKVISGYLDLFKQEGYGKVSLEKIVELRDRGVSPDFISSFHEMGYKDMSLDLAQELQDQGVTANYIKKMQDKGLKNLSLDQYIRLKDSGM